MSWGKPWALLFTRLVLGFIFFMAGWWKVFELGPVEHARRLFIVPYADTFLPRWALWPVGTAIPIVELIAGGLVLVGLFRRVGYLALGAVLVIVTFGHLVKEALYPFHEHVIPRLGLLLIMLWNPLELDRFSLDEWIGSGKREPGTGNREPEFAP